ncbi:MAG: malectin domain-containing carbohydrate-binding protein, partial [Pirellulales bacterium]
TQITTTNPLTGREEPWRFVRTYGCNTAVASEHLITFRSGAASYYDLKSKSGTMNMGGFRSGCSSNLIAAEGVLNAPDYTRTCNCGYQNQTSVGLIHMPDVEVWSVSLVEAPKPNDRVQRVGLNLGAPGDRRTSEGTVWLEYPVVAGEASPLSAEVDGSSARYFRHHGSMITDGELPWVTASGAIDLRRLAIRLGPENNGEKTETRRYTVRLFFAEPEDVEEGDRVFDVSLQGDVVVRGLDVVKKANGRFKGIVGVFRHVPVDQQLVIELAPHAKGKQGTLLCGVECIAE